MEVSKLDRENETLTELRQRRDGAGYYAYRYVLFSLLTGFPVIPVDIRNLHGFLTQLFADADCRLKY